MKAAGLFITLEKFKGYTSKEKLEFIQKMKRHRLMSRQAKAWGYGHNYLSQIYFNLKNEQSLLKKKRGAQKKSVQKRFEILEEKLQAKEEIATIEENTNEDSEEVTAELEIKATAITPELAIEVVNYFKEKMNKGTLELNLKDSSNGCDLTLVAKEA